jgi:hypothetical protein
VIPFSCCSLEGVSESVIIAPLLEEPMLTSGSVISLGGHQLCVPGMPSPAELKTVGDDSCSTLEEEEDTMRLYVCV